MNTSHAIILIILFVYILSLLFILLYSLTQGYLAFSYLRLKKINTPNGFSASPDIPFVTVQLPVYNELYVVERLIDAVSNLDYPAEKFEIQVLDDSDDETYSIAAARISHWKNKGIQIHHIRRESRTGYKAGALKEGLKTATGAFIAIFDADFVPHPDFLKRALVPFQNNPNTGMVQTRWTHLNKNNSLLTRAQAFTIDAHFHIEQTGRHGTGCFINFNGTAGIWRKTCIIDAGNWHTDTLTEDLDLSYRAQLKGWQFVYLENTTSPAELPPIMSAVKSQQYRWNKGGAETARKLWIPLLKAHLPFKVKWNGSFHLLSSAVFIAVFLSAVCSIPLLHFKTMFPQYRGMYAWLSVFLISFIIVAWIYYIVCRQQQGGVHFSWKRYLKEFPLFLSFSMGLSLHNAIAVLEGYAGRKTPFIRTPKFNAAKGINVYIQNKITLLSLMEVGLVFYFAYGVFFSFKSGDFTMLPFHLMLTMGFAIVSYYTLFHQAYKNAPATAS